MPNYQTEIYKTKDLSEASMLIVKKQKMISLQREGRTCWFIFANKADCEKLSHEYYYGEVLVNALDYHEAISRLKGRIFAED